MYGPGDPGGLPAATAGVDTPAPVGGTSQTPGIAEYFARSVEASAYDLNIRTRYNNRKGLAPLIQPHEISLPSSVKATVEGPYSPSMEPFEVFQDDRVKVSATLVEHPPVFPSYAYRFETEDAVLVFSGDTARCENLVRMAQGADLLVHESMNIDFYAKLDYQKKLLEFFTTSHTAPADVGRVAKDAGVRRVAVNHLGPPDPRAVTDENWARAIQRQFDGRVTVGHDLEQGP